MNKKFIFYIFILFFFGSLIWYVIGEGNSIIRTNNFTKEHQVSNNNIDLLTNIKNNHNDSSPELLKIIKQSITNPISILILQLIVIIVFARIFGFFFSKMGQPTVIGEIIAGIMLGPSVLGLFFPEISVFIFPICSFKNLEILSQIGLVLFMFIVGMNLDVKVLRNKIQSALVISHTSIIIAYFMGIVLSYIIYDRFAPADVTFFEFALFIGIAMSIAAFPVLARIVQEKGLTKTSIGKTIITIAAVDDFTAWCILAMVITVIQAGNAASAFISITLALIYVMLMFFIVQPFMKRIGNIYISKEILNKNIIAFVFFVLFLSAYFTEVIGIKALFGGFMAGVIMPSNQNFKKIMAEKIEDFGLVVLLPLFFVLTGLRTHIGLMNDSNAWLVCGIVILFAIIGKFGSSVIASKIVGQNWKNSFIIGALMNTRGLMELIVLNIGYDLGVISSEIFTIMVIMTLVTTFMTGPILSFIEFISKKRTISIAEIKEHKTKIMISFGMPQTGGAILKLLNYFVGNEIQEKKVSALHLTPHTEISRADALKYEKISFAKIKSVARELNYKLNTIYKTTNNVAKEIVRITKVEQCNLLLMGAAKSMFAKNVIGGKVRNIIEQVACNVGIFIDKDFNNLSNTLLLINSNNYKQLLNLGTRLIHNSQTRITIIDEDNMRNAEPNTFDNFLMNADDFSRAEIIQNVTIDNDYLQKFDLLITDINYCEDDINQQTLLLDSYPSLLILNFKNEFFL